MLHCIPSDLSRDEWFKVLAAAKDAGLSLHDATQWSAQASNFASAREVKTTWNSIRSGIITAATLYHYAEKYGYQGTGEIYSFPQAEPEPQHDDIKQLEAILNQTVVSPKIGDYFKARGLSITPPEILRFAELDYWHEGKKIGRYGAMVAPIMLGKELTGLHLTYLEDNHKINDYPAKKMRSRYPSSNRGAAIQLYKPNKTLAIAEGIETASAVHEITGLPCWAVLSASGMKTFIPPIIDNLIIFADNDKSKTGWVAANYLKARLKPSGIKVFIKMPVTVGHDWLDELRGNV